MANRTLPLVALIVATAIGCSSAPKQKYAWSEIGEPVLGLKDALYTCTVEADVAKPAYLEQRRVVRTFPGCMARQGWRWAPVEMPERQPDHLAQRLDGERPK